MSKFQAIHISEAEPAQIRSFAVEFLGLDIDAGDSEAEVLAKVMTAHDSETIFIAPPPEVGDMTGDNPLMVDGARDTAIRLAGGYGSKDPKVRLVINTEERDGTVYKVDVPVGVNGKHWLLKRGVEMLVPYRVFLALKDACKTVVTEDPNTQEIYQQQVPHIPYNVLQMPSAAEIEAFHERTRDLVFPD